MRRFIAFFVFALLSPAYAGTWGPGVFDSDQSLDTSSIWAESGTIDDVRDALQRALSQDYLEAPEAEDALVAAEVVAASWGMPNKKLPEGLARWIDRQPSAGLRALTEDALAAIARVRSAERSELHELWAEGDADEWLSQLDDLESRLRRDRSGT